MAQGDRHREAALRGNLADLLHDAGHPEDAMGELKRAVAVFAEVGRRRGAAARDLEARRLVTRSRAVIPGP